MRHRKVSKRPFECGGGFSAARKLKPDRLPTMDDLMKRWKDHVSARDILREAKKLGIDTDRFGESDKDINYSIGAAAMKYSRRDIGYCRPLYAVASIIIANNDFDTAKWLINEMVPKAEEKEVEKHLGNISAIMEEIRNLGLSIEDLGSRTREYTADEIVRVATNNKYSSAKNALVVIMLEQRAEEAKDIILKKIVPQCGGSELFSISSYINGRVGNKKLDEQEGRELIEKIKERLDKIWMAP